MNYFYEKLNYNWNRFNNDSQPEKTNNGIDRISYSYPNGSFYFIYNMIVKTIRPLLTKSHFWW